jgi:hypothetical protein
LHIEGFTAFQIWVVRLLFLAAVSLLLLSWRQLSARLVGLSIMIFFIVVANAFVTGTMSMVDERYGSRVIWLIPFLTGLLVMHWVFARRTAVRSGLLLEKPFDVGDVLRETVRRE